MMGANDFGQLGVQSKASFGDQSAHGIERTGSPCLVELLKNHRVEKLACGKNFTMAITMSLEQQTLAT